MDELQSVRELFAEPPPPSARVVVQARRGATGARRRLPRARWALPGLGLVAAATATVVALAGVSDSPGSGGPAHDPVSARQVLLTAAAASTTHVTSKQGTYWFTEYQASSLDVIRGKTLIVSGRRAERPLPAFRKKGTYLVQERRAHKDWTNAHSPHRTHAEIKAGRGGSTTHFWADQKSEIRPLGPADIAEWKRAGSPSVFTVPIPDGTTGRLSTKAMPWQVHKEQTAYESPFADGSLKQLQSLPTDPAKLRRYILAHPNVNERNRQDWESDAQYLLDAGTYMLASEPIPAAVRKAVYQMLADVPEVRAVGSVHDPLGRPGVAVATGGNARGENRIIIDPATGRLLAGEFVSGTRGLLPRGQVESWTAYVTAGWTDKAPAHATPLPG